MPWESPYRGEESPFSPRVRELLSRGAILFVGGALIYFAIRGMVGLHHRDLAATTQPVYIFRHGQRVQESTGGYWLLMFLLGGFGLVTFIAGLLPANVGQRLFESFNRPPVTGDRSPETDDWYRPWGSRRRYGGRWSWWWSDD